MAIRLGTLWFGLTWPAVLGAQGFALVKPGTVPVAPGEKEMASLLGAADAAARPPRARALLHVEGTLPHAGIYDESFESLKDMEAVRDLALAWKLTGKDPYLRSCGDYFGAWLSVYRSSSNPIDETRFDNFLLAYDLAGSQLPSRTKARMKDFLREMAQGYLAGRNITMEGTRVNNWQSHRVKLAALAAFQLGDGELIQKARAAFQKQLGDNLEADGAVLDFKERDALHYTVYDLEPLAMAALAAKAHGQDWYHLTGANGASLEKALEWLAPFAEGKEQHLEFVHSTIAFDAQRRAAGVEGFGGPWDPRGAADLYALAARLDPRWEPLSRKLEGAPLWLDCLFPLSGR